MKKVCIFLLGICSITQVLASNLNVGEIDLDFCNEGGNKLNISMDAGTSTGICMNIKNLSQKEGKVSLVMVDGEMSQGEQPVQACKTSNNGLFGKSVSLLGETNFVIQPGETIQRTGTITILSGFAGNIYGCATYTVSDIQPDVTKENEMFAIVSRKANTITITVSGEVTSNILLIQDIDISKNADGVYSLSLSIKNDGTVAERMDGTITIHDNIGQYEQMLDVANNTQIYPGEQKDFKFEIGKLPWYGGVYSFKLVLDHVPVDITGVKVGPGGRITSEKDIKTGILQYGFFPILGGILGLLVILFFIERPFVKRRQAKKRAKKEAKRLAKLEKHHQKHEDSE